MINNEQLNKIKHIGLRIDHEDAFSGKSKGNKHLERTVKLASFLAQQIGADINITRAATWLHDTALPTGNDYNYDNNLKIIKNILKNLEINDKEKVEIAKCVASHEGTVNPESLEAKAVHDADVLEKVGLLGTIRHTWKLTNLEIIDPKNIKQEDIQKVVKHLEWRKSRLQLNEARELANYLSVKINPEQTSRIIKRASKMAMNGIITETIAQSLADILNNKQMARLNEQINQSYLVE